MAAVQLNNRRCVFKTVLPERQPPIPTPEYNEWLRLLKKSTRKFDTLLKFLLNLVIYTGENVSLIFTLITGLILPDDREETFAAIVLYILTCMVTATVNLYNQPSHSRVGRKYTMKSLLLNMCFLAKPIRYMRSFVIRNRRYRVIKRESKQMRDGEFISERSIQSLAIINEVELQENRNDMLETFIQHLPMTLLQTYFLFSTHQRFQLCNVKDLSRLAAILTPLLHAAKAVQTFEATQLSYKQTIHFLDFYRTGGNNPMLIYSNDSFSIGGVTCLVAHLTSISLRFYTATYFLVVSPFISLIYLASVYVVNDILLWICPLPLLDIFQNPPHGVSTIPSYMADRYINIFANVGTRFNLMTRDPVIFHCRLPLVLLQILHFAIPLAVVYSTSYYYDIPTSPSGIPSSAIITTINDTLATCPELGSIYQRHPAIAAIGDMLFSTYKSMDNRFQTFNDIFDQVHLLWLLFYIQILFTWVYAYADLVRRTPKNGETFHETFPVVAAQAYYDTLLEQVLMKPAATRLKAIRKLMIATVLKNGEFYNAITILGLFRKSSLSSKQVERYTDRVLNRLKITDEQDVDERIRACFVEGHQFRGQFRRMLDEIVDSGESDQVRLRDKKLFCGFFAYFDRKVSEMSSDRIQRIFGIMGMDVLKGDDGLGDRSVLIRGLWEV